MRSGICVLCMLVIVCGVVLGGDVTVTFYGHSCFSVQEEDGPIVMIDPFATYVPYPGLPAAADVVLMTHGHIDHCPRCYGEHGRVTGDPVVVWPFDSEGRVQEGDWQIREGVVVRFIEATHVTIAGGGQGLVSLFCFDLGGIRFAHLGDLGRPLTGEQVSALEGVDVLFMPVGGAYTIDSLEAESVIDQIPSVRIVFPMHYFVEDITPWADLAPISGFTEQIMERWVVREPEIAFVTLSSESLPQEVEVWVLDYAR